MNKIILLLGEILKEIEKENPLGLIGKGGTILTHYHLGHRDSQDLDFDCLVENKGKDFEKYFRSIFDRVIEKHKIAYKINKSPSFSSKGRFHMNVTFSTYKELPSTKMEINFIDKLPDDLISQGEFRFYSLESLFYQKLKASASRGEIKDIIDVGVALKSKEPILDVDRLKKYDKICELIDCAIITLNDLQKNPAGWKQEFGITQLKFTINEKGFPSFIEHTKRGLHILNRKLKA